MTSPLDPANPASPVSPLNPANPIHAGSDGVSAALLRRDLAFVGIGCVYILLFWLFAWLDDRSRRCPSVWGRCANAMIIAPIIVALALLASQCLAENDASVRQFDERNEIAVAASQFEGRTQVDSSRLPSASEHGGKVVADPLSGFGVDPRVSAQQDAYPLRDDASPSRTQDRQPERRPVSRIRGEDGRTEGSRRDRPFEHNDHARWEEPVQNTAYEFVCHPAYCRAENGLDAHGSYDTITRLLDLQNEKLAKIKARTTWTLVLMVAFLVYHTLDFFFLAFLARLSD